MKTAIRPAARGIALIVVLIAIFVLTVLVGAFAYSMKVETKLAMNSNQEADLYWIGKSGVQFASWVLAQQLIVPNEPYDSLNQKWAGGPGTLAASNSPLADVSLENVPLGNGKFTVKITDLNRRININMANQDVLQQALTLMGVDASEIPSVANYILDWIDRDEATRINGVESDYYEGLQPPYLAKNAPIDDLSELLLIKGVTLEMYWGAEARSHIPAAFQRVDRFGNVMETPPYTVGLAEVFTPISNGKVNINTASSTVLQMIPGIDQVSAECIIRQRSGPDGADGTEDDLPFQSANELGECVSGHVMQTVQRLCATRSTAFEVQVDAEIAGAKRTFYAIVGRNSQRDVQVLSFYWK